MNAPHPHPRDPAATAASATAGRTQRQEEFLALLSHELRNPLAPISNSVQLLRRLSGEHEDIRRLRAVDLIDRQVRHLTRLVDDLLDASRITRGQMRMERRAQPLAHILSAGIERARAQIDARDHCLTVIDPEHVTVMADEARLAQAIGNLLDNAARYTARGGRIELWTQSEEQHVSIHVRDTGMGIAPSLLAQVFEPFTQGKRTLDRAEGGLGLGLSLVRSVVLLHEGSISAHSAGEGQGSEFVVRLPRLLRDPSIMVHPSMGSDASGWRVLVVDDNTDSADSLAALLEMDGHSVAVAHDGHAALARAEAFQPQAALLDIGLPGMDGLELARRIRAQPRLRDTVLVAVTGYGRPQDIQRSRAAGFDDHVVKPFDPQTLGRLFSGRQTVPLCRRAAMRSSE